MKSKCNGSAPQYSNGLDRICREEIRPVRKTANFNILFYTIHQKDFLFNEHRFLPHPGSGLPVPYFPVPANRSRNDLPAMGWMMLKNASLIRSAVGRMRHALGT